MAEEKDKKEPETETETEGKEDLLFNTPLEEIFEGIMNDLHADIEKIDTKKVKNQNE